MSVLRGKSQRKCLYIVLACKQNNEVIETIPIIFV